MAAAVEGPALSAEQTEAITNVVVDQVHTVVTACPGAGKSTVFREGLRTIAMRDPFAAVAIVSYNRALKNETEAKVEQMDFPETFQVDSFTSHGLLGHMFGSMVPDDLTAYQLLRSTASVATPPADYSYIFIDEAQDMSILTAQIINRLISTLPDPPVLFVVGDLRQQLYGELNMDFTGSIALRSPTEVFEVPGEWRHVNFNRSFRLSPKSADWLSRAFRLTGPNRIIGANTRSANLDVSYAQELRGKELQHAALDAVLELLKNYPPGKIIVKANSVDYSGELRHIVNTLYKNNIPVYVSDYRRGTSNGSEADGKILVTTCFQAKGLEREASLVLLQRSFGRAEGQFDPAWFVGMSRHTEMMIVIDSRENPYFCVRGGQPQLPPPSPPRPLGHRTKASFALHEGKVTRFTRIGVILNLVERMAPRIRTRAVPLAGENETLEMPRNPAIRENVGRYFKDAIQILTETALRPNAAPTIARQINESLSTFKNRISHYFADWDQVSARVFAGEPEITGRDAMMVAAAADAFGTGYHHLVSRLAAVRPHWVTVDMERYVEVAAERAVAALLSLGVPLDTDQGAHKIGPGNYYASRMHSAPSIVTADGAVVEIELAPREDDAIKFQQKDIDLLVRMYVLGCTKAHIVLCATSEIVTFELDAETIEGYVHSILESKYLPR